MSTDDRPDLREYPPLIEALTEESKLTGEPFDELMDREVSWANAQNAAAAVARAAAKNPPPLDAPAGPAVRKFRALLK